LDGKPLKPKGKTEADRPRNDARSSVGKHAWETLRRALGEPQMQRVARSWKVGCRRHRRSATKPRFGEVLGTDLSAERHPVSEPPGGRRRSSDPNQPPDGTGRRRMSRARNAGPQGPPEVEAARTGKVARPEPARPDATSITMLAPTVRWHARCSDMHHRGRAAEHPGKGDRPNSTGTSADERGAGSNAGPISFGGLGEKRFRRYRGKRTSIIAAPPTPHLAANRTGAFPLTLPASTFLVLRKIATGSLA
jgi:hypothetical protein